MKNKSKYFLTIYQIASATGGQPAQIYYMKKDDLPIPISTLVLMIVTLAYKFVLVMLGGLIFLFRPERMMLLLHENH